MNSFQGNNGTVFEFNNDYSGRIIVYRTNGEGVVEIDGKDFFQFSKYAVGRDIISKIEQEYC